jgi:hypothetical protein
MHDFENDARSAMLTLAIMLEEEAAFDPEPSRQKALVALRRTYGDLDRADVSTGELRRAAFASGLAKMTAAEVRAAAARL